MADQPIGGAPFDDSNGLLGGASLSSTPLSDDTYDKKAGEKLANWCHGLLEHDGDARKKITRETEWASDWAFLNGKQWEGSQPTYRRPIVVNAWRRVFHVVLAVLLGSRPMLKVVPQGPANPGDIETWQAALWSTVRLEDVIRKCGESLSDALINDGGWIKIGYGTRSGLDKYTGDNMIPELADVMVTSPKPNKVYPDPDCTDLTLSECSRITFRDVLDLGTIGKRYPANAKLVKPDGNVSLKWSGSAPDWVGEGAETISPVGGWTPTKQYRRACATIAETWIDDHSPEYIEKEEVVDYQKDPITGLPAKSLDGSGALIPITRKIGRWQLKYPYGRVITCTKDVVLRDIPNPYGKAFGWAKRWPFVYFPGAESPHVLWRPGLVSGLGELQKALNKMSSLLLENAIKITNALVIADESAMDDEDWDLLSLIPGAKLRKRQGTDLKVVFPQPLPSHAFQVPEHFEKKIEQSVGLHDPPISPGQAVAAKTVSYLQQKGAALLGGLSKNLDESIERVGDRVVALQIDRYMPGRPIPFFNGQEITEFKKYPALPAGLRLRVEASSAVVEITAAMQEAAAADAQAKKGRRK